MKAPHIVDVVDYHAHSRMEAVLEIGKNAEPIEASRVRKEVEPSTYPVLLINDNHLAQEAEAKRKLDAKDMGQYESESVLAIKESKGETVEHSAKLFQREDDDSSELDIELVYEKNGQARLDGPISNGPNEPAQPIKQVAERQLSPQVDSKGTIAFANSKSSARYTFPSYEECERMKEKADMLPDLLHVPFADTVENINLEGWEDEWIAKARYTGPKLSEPKIDIVYNWVNGSQPEFVATMRPYEMNSTLNDPEGLWIESHSTNRYREWDELRFSLRSIEKYAGSFTNRIQILVNALKIDSDTSITYDKQRPLWLMEGPGKVQVLSQEEFFGQEEKKCLPTFDSLTLENQLYNTHSETDRLFALSDDMILGKLHAASDLYSPLFGPTMGFKDNAYNTLQPPTEKDAERFGEKPFLIYTSWLLNRRFGARKRKGQVHLGHSLSRSVAKEAITSFPRPALRSAFQRFRGETGFQLYSWYVVFHYTMERHREVLLWSYIVIRSDHNNDGYLDWDERQRILHDLSEGISHESPEKYRRRIFYHVADVLKEAGLEPPKVNTNILWTSLDGPVMIKDLDCDAFDTEDCLAPGFSVSTSDQKTRSPVFNCEVIFDRIARQSPRCGDCLLKLILNRRSTGLGTLLPHPVRQSQQRELVIKAVMKYQYTIVDPDAAFYMVTDAEQAEHILLNPYVKHNKRIGQMCLNDDVVTTEKRGLEQLKRVMRDLLVGLLPERSTFEKEDH